MTITVRPACANCGAPAFDRCDDCDRWRCLHCGRLDSALRFACRPLHAVIPSAHRGHHHVA